MIALSSDEERAEAQRLLNLDASGLQVEAVAIALRLRRQSEQAMGNLHELDARTLEWAAGSPDSGGLGAPEGAQ